jgi:hypothetical protein
MQVQNTSSSEEQKQSAPATQSIEQGETHAESDAATEVKEDKGLEATEGGESQDSPDGERKPKVHGAEKRVKKLLKRNTAIKQEMEYWRSQALKSQSTQSTQPETRVEAKAEGKPRADDFDTHEAYVEALADWKVDQKIAQRESKLAEEQAKKSYAERVQTHNERVEEFAKEHEDFHDRLEDVADVQLSIAVQEAILSSDNGPALMYELAKDPTELDRIIKLPPIAAARELGRMEARLAKAETPEKQAKEITKTKAPEPIKPVNAKVAAVKKSIYDPDIPFTEYMALRREQLRRKV